MPQFHSRPEFFLDRSLAGRVADALRAAGWNVRTHMEVYGPQDQEVEDVEWLELCGREGWVALTKDRRVRYRRYEIAAVRRHRVRAFALAGGNLRAADQARRFLENEAEIATACGDPGPFIYAVYVNRIERIFPA
jgi:hypothetical protein